MPMVTGSDGTPNTLVGVPIDLGFLLSDATMRSDRAIDVRDETAGPTHLLHVCPSMFVFNTKCGPPSTTKIPSAVGIWSFTFKC